MSHDIESRQRKLSDGTEIILDGGYTGRWYSFSVSFWKKGKWIKTKNLRRRTEREMLSVFKNARS